MAEPKVISRATSALSMRKDPNVNYTELQDHEDLKKQRVHTDNPSAFQAWPTQPKALVLAQRDQLLYNALDYLLIALPIGLIIKTGLCILAHHKDQGNTGVSIDEVSLMTKILIDLNSQLVTLFTIVFATIMSIFVKRYALWKAQHGAYVADLEQFQGSAVKLEYRLTLSEPYDHIKAAVQKSDAPSCFSPDLGNFLIGTSYTLHDFKAQTSYLEILNTNFAAIVIDQYNLMQNLPGTQPNYGTRNGAPLIPNYYTAASLISQKSLTDKIYHFKDHWIDVSQQSMLKNTYMSSTGQTLWISLGYDPRNKTYFYDASAVPFLGSYTVSNISYLNISCSDPVVHPAWAFPNGTSGAWGNFNMVPLSTNATKDRNGYPLRELDYWYKLSTRDSFENTTNPNPDLEDYDPTIDGQFNYTVRAVQSTCTLTTKYIDMKVNCLTTGCYPSRLRWVNGNDEMEAIGYSTPFHDDQFATNFLSNYINSTGPPNSESPSLLDNVFGFSYALDGTIWSTLGPARWVTSDSFELADSYLPVTNVTFGLDLLLSQGFNTYYMLSQAVVSDYIRPNMQEIFTNGKYKDGIFKSVSAKGGPLNQGYRIHWQWIPVDFAACSILLVMAIGAYWLRINTLAPDIFGYVSSLTRDNPHLRLPTEGSALSGVDRARMLKGVKVKIGDVRTGVAGESDLGRIGLAPVEADVRPLYGQRVYL